ncbi:MAG: PAS domain S-box protein, partial [Verrucomicrobia bacterium]|nr:PAS domain S-box protein [Verrucomicrobiota bacterium]
MKTALRVLIIEDVLADVVMINSELRRGGLQFRCKRVETKESFLEEIHSDPPDVILADHGLPTFDSCTALAIAQDECPQVPFIFVTGAMDAEMAVKTLKGGATDYVLKSHLDQLAPAVKRALQQAGERTKHHETESALRESEERFRLLVDGAKDYAIFMLDARGRITSWNAGAEWIENYHADEILGRPIACLFPETGLGAQSLQEALREAEREGRFEGEGWSIRKSGARFWSKTVIIPLPKKGKVAQGFTVVLQDVSQRHEIEETWKLYEAIVNTAKDFLTLIDSSYRYVAANDAYCRAHGKSREQIVGATVAELWGGEIFQTLIREHLEKCFSGQDVRYRAWFEFPELGRRFFEVSYYPHFGQEAVTHAIVVTRDITDLAQAQALAQTLRGDLEKRVAEQTVELKAAYQELEGLCYSIAHDLKAP